MHIKHCPLTFFSSGSEMDPKYFLVETCLFSETIKVSTIIASYASFSELNHYVR